MCRIGLLHVKRSYQNSRFGPYHDPWKCDEVVVDHRHRHSYASRKPERAVGAPLSEPSSHDQKKKRVFTIFNEYQRTGDRCGQSLVSCTRPARARHDRHYTRTGLRNGLRVEELRFDLLTRRDIRSLRHAPRPAPQVAPAHASRQSRTAPKQVIAVAMDGRRSSCENSVRERIQGCLNSGRADNDDRVARQSRALCVRTDSAGEFGRSSGCGCAS